MAAHRLYIGDDILSDSADEIVLRGANAHRIVHVLRLQQGAELSLIGNGRECMAVVTERGVPVRLRVLSELPPPETLLPYLTLYPALIRLNRFEWLIEKATELGVSAFVPVIAERSTVRASEIGSARLERWRRIAIEAMEQSRGLQPPLIAEPIAFGSALEQARGTRVVAWEGLHEAPPAATLARVRAERPNTIALFIGPEGGFSEAEIGRATAIEATLIGLGPRLLRAETAALVASALLLLE
ncbi:MAG: RsmE family RNA methyltransferase [Dehalococcoidia bacterium]